MSKYHNIKIEDTYVLSHLSTTVHKIDFFTKALTLDLLLSDYEIGKTAEELYEVYKDMDVLFISNLIGQLEMDAIDDWDDSDADILTGKTNFLDVVTFANDATEETGKEFNQCADLTSSDTHNEGVLKYDELLASNIDPFTYMMKMQYDLQYALSAKCENIPYPDSLKTLGEKYDWLDFNKRAFDDEYGEIIDALAGMSMASKDRSAVWKKWKSKYNDVRALTFDDLSESDLTELKFELADSFHFYMNMFFALDMTPKELFSSYYTKNHENHKRSQNGY